MSFGTAGNRTGNLQLTSRFPNRSATRLPLLTTLQVFRCARQQSSCCRAEIIRDGRERSREAERQSTPVVAHQVLEPETVNVRLEGLYLALVSMPEGSLP